MLVAINARFTGRRQPTGTQRAAAATVSALLQGPRTWRALLLADPASPDTGHWATLAGVVVAPVPWSRWGRGRAQLFEQLHLDACARRQGADLLFNPLQTAPIIRARLPQIVTVHDLHFFHHPEWFGRSFRWWNSQVTVRAIRGAAHVVAISDHVLGDLRSTLGLPAERSSRIYNVGPRPRAARVPSANTNPTLFCLNSFQPHKNLARLAAAFAQLRSDFPALQLRIAGRPQENFARTPGLAELASMPGVRLLGYLPDEQLQAEYASATVFCYPSLSEGFGLPVLEAGAAGTVVVTSRTTALPEIAGDAAFLVDPFSIDSIANGIRRALCLSPDERQDWISRARANLARFRPESVCTGYGWVFDQHAISPTGSPVRIAAAT